MNDLNCGRIIKESGEVLSWNGDIFLMHYLQQEEISRANMCVHMDHISIVLKGQKEILGQGSKILIPSGSGFFIRKGSYLISDKFDGEDGAYEAILIFFSDSWLRSQVESIYGCSNGANAVNSVETHEDIALLTEDGLMNTLALQLKSYLCQGADRERLSALLPIKIRELFQVLITARGGHHFEMQLRNLDTHLNPDLVPLMESNYRENISLEQYAFLANCSLSTFKRRFLQTFKMNPGKWIMQRRLETAYELLVNSDKNVTEIAYEVGFETPAHFIVSFKQKYRDTPKQVKQKL
ncbi:helix-turn-helix transcriptional regulator [Pedobacter sp. UBA5917]|jgi:AraC-like DNA-binding protein|uniref:helix-turn-helix transcriptional regulator n=1 Tax=Pedobacter sp. UBA5917 TaxID=1947061 RepID=UPI0025D65CEB|nr:AraC family transcriptional regulator [Pedobacter sp. UBA5917]